MRDADKEEPAVRMEHVSKKFGERAVLKDVSFDVAHGEAFCLLGRSGAGKSVTLKTMIGLLKPDSGRVFVEGHEMAKLVRDELGAARKKMGYLFQDAALFDSISVAENVAFPLRRNTSKSNEEIRSIVQSKLDEVELGKEGKQDACRTFRRNAKARGARTGAGARPRRFVGG